MRALLYAATCVSQILTANTSRESELLVDFDYRTACGPISCFAALRSLGNRTTSLDDVIRFCGWQEGKTSTLLELQYALRQVPGVETRAVRLSPEKLTELLAGGNCAAILTVRRKSNEVNHACCALRSRNGQILTIDYPELAKWSSSESLVDTWDGRALLVWHSESPPRLRVLAESTIPGFMLGVVLIAFSSRLFGHRHQQVP